MESFGNVFFHKATLYKQSSLVSLLDFIFSQMNSMLVKYGLYAISQLETSIRIHKASKNHVNTYCDETPIQMLTLNLLIYLCRSLFSAILKQ